MKTAAIILISILALAGCTTQPVAMKTKDTYFTPARITTMAKAGTVKGATKVTSITSAQSKINEKETIIELLRKENRELRERIQRLEKKLQIQNS
jgi:uncharacterized lipoprotein YajG